MVRNRTARQFAESNTVLDSDSSDGSRRYTLNSTSVRAEAVQVTGNQAQASKPLGEVEPTELKRFHVGFVLVRRDSFQMRDTLFNTLIESLELSSTKWIDFGWAGLEPDVQFLFVAEEHPHRNTGSGVGVGVGAAVLAARVSPPN
jgi:hypothetical protein